ncbi:MAG: hypothetical protein JWN76_413 [Chitinophagaceae bacterium]|nr:hypothetical protein [Chitinophagaceae bacterium]
MNKIVTVFVGIVLVITLPYAGSGQNRTRYFNRTWIGYHLVVSSGSYASKNAFELLSVNGLQFSQNEIGIGVGLRGYHTPSYNTLPIYLEYNKIFNKSATLLSLDAGTSARISGNFTGGGFFSVGLSQRLLHAKPDLFIGAKYNNEKIVLPFIPNNLTVQLSAIVITISAGF